MLAPTVTGNGVTTLTGSSAIVTGTVNANGEDTTVYIQYGTSPGYGLNTATQDVGGGYGNVLFTGTLTGLSSLTPYYYQVVAVNT